VTFTLATSGAIFKSFTCQDQPGHPFLQYAGKTNNAGASGGFGGTLPTYRFFTSLDWRYRDLEITVNNTYVSATDDTGVNGTSTPLIPVSSYSTWDLREAYDWHPSHANEARILTFALGVNNLTNRLPPLAPRAFVDNNADVATVSRSPQASLQALDRLRAVRDQTVERAAHRALPAGGARRASGGVCDRPGAETRGGLQVGGSRDRLRPRRRRHHSRSPRAQDYRRQPSLLTGRGCARRSARQLAVPSSPCRLGI